MAVGYWAHQLEEWVVQLRGEGSVRKSWALRNYAWVEAKSQTVAYVLWLVPGLYIREQ